MLTIETEGRYRNKITLTKGDSAALKIKVRDARNKVVPLVFHPDDTAGMECGKYCYDVQVTLSNGNVYTVIPPAQFFLEKGVT